MAPFSSNMKTLIQSTMKVGGNFDRVKIVRKQVILTWIWFLASVAVVILAIFAYNGFDLGLTFELLSTHRHLTVYIELSSVGLIPLIYTILEKESPSQFGIYRKNLTESLLYAILGSTIFFLLKWLITGQTVEYEEFWFPLDYPGKLFYGFSGTIVWGPLEVYFFIWLMEKTEYAFLEDHQKRFTKGFVVTLVLFGLAHVVTTDLFNAFYISSIFLVLGLMYKITKNSIGQMIMWTFINGQVWFIAQMLFQI